MSTTSPATPEAQAPIVVVVIEKPANWTPAHALDMPPGAPRPIRGIQLRSMTPDELRRYNSEVMTEGGSIWGYALEFADENVSQAATDPEPARDPAGQIVGNWIEAVADTMAHAIASDMHLEDHEAAGAALSIDYTGPFLVDGPAGPVYRTQMTVLVDIPPEAVPTIAEDLELGHEMEERLKTA